MVSQQLPPQDPWADQEPQAHPPAWSAEQAALWRASQPRGSIWRVVFMQALLGVVLVVAAYVYRGQADYPASLAYGVATVVLPGALFARALQGRLSRQNAASAAVVFVVWEVLKIALTLLLLVVAAKGFELWGLPLSWPMLLLGLVVTVKVYWVALLWQGSPLKNKES
jgi:ATP synthase protein I